MSVANEDLAIREATCLIYSKIAGIEKEAKVVHKLVEELTIKFQERTMKLESDFLAQSSDIRSGLGRSSNHK